MRKIGFLIATLGMVVAPLLAAAPANAQATRTWVSGVGDDVNPCSRTAPCKTFAGAISKTAAGGEISVLDPGGFGGVTITKSMTLNGDGTLASILNAGSVNGVIVNAGAGGKVVLRNLSINGSTGSTPGLNGIRYLSGAELTVDRCVIQGDLGTGIDVALSTTGSLFVTNTLFTEVVKGINMNTTAGFATGSVTDSRFYGNVSAAVASTSNNVFLEVSRSTMTNNGVAASITAGNGTISVSDSLVTGNTTAFSAVAGSTIRITRNIIMDNPTAFSGTIQTGGDNKTAGNGAGGTLAGGVATQ
jgi:hypothetical protein